MFLRCCRSFLLAGLLALSQHVPLEAQGFLHASGLYIVDGSNNQIILRGMGLGGWLVPEGYMLGTSSFADSPTALKNVVTQLVGAQNADTFFQAYRASFVRKTDIDSLAKWGFNSVRLPMHYNLLTSAPGVYTESGFAIIDSLLDWCESNRMYLILDLHAAPGGQNTGGISDYQGPPSLWESTLYQDWTASLWKTIAARYKNEPWIGGYDLINEPAWNFPAGNSTLRAFLVRLTDSIRTVDQNHLIFAEGNWYATDFNGLTPAWDANMAWSFHKYWNVNDYGAISYLLSLRSNTQRPLWLGESGENSNHWFSECLMWMELNKIGWSWWTLKKIESISCPLSVTKTAGFDALIRYWSGQGSAPSVTTAMTYLLEQANKFESQNTTLRPDYLNALFGSPTPGQRKPYARLVIPGTIPAVHYDMGKNQEAYVDVDFQNVNGNGGSTCNTGWTYRNDGVDIERSSDPQGNGFNVGWTTAGEWLGYTVHVATGGTYAISARVASATGGGSMSLVLDGGESLPYNITSTGG
ncbi:MAG: cellulase family glycosylhydrolase, partial [Bacteroidetes bacterium]|nr:cellulase family glycosylhydrolase [Bacteroidota bacterium]